MVDRRVFAGDEQGRLDLLTLLFAFLGAPVLWALHLSLGYFLVTLDCITPWNGAHWALAAATALAAAGALAAGWTARRLWRRLGPARPEPDERAWRRFLLVAGMTASLLFTLVIITQGVAPYFVDLCR